MKTNTYLNFLCLIIGLAPLTLQANPLTVLSCEGVVQWRGLSPESNLSKLDNASRMARQSTRDKEEVYSFFENLAEYHLGRRTLQQASQYPNTLYAPRFFVDHFARVYSDRAQFELFVNTLYRIGYVLNIPMNDISQGALLPRTVPVRDAWENLLLNIGDVNRNPRNVTLLTLTLFIELELSHQQGHPFAFLDESAHRGYANMLEKVMLNQILKNENRQIVKSSIEELFNSMQFWVKQKQEFQAKNKVSNNVFEGQSDFSQVLQKLPLKDLKTAIVQYDLVLKPLIQHLEKTLEGRPEVAVEMVKRAQQTILKERPELADKPNFVISLDKLSDPRNGTQEFVQGMFHFSKFQGLWSFAALFKNIPEPDQLPMAAQEAIKKLFKEMDSPQPWP